MTMGPVTRRRFLEASAGAAAAMWLAPRDGERVLGTVPFVDEPAFPLETSIGAGLGQRRALDLSTLTPDGLVISPERFFVRTGCPDRLPPAATWAVRAHGLLLRPMDLKVEDLRREAVAQGVHLIECSGNSRGARFGLIGAARWTGVPWTGVIERLRPQARATQVLVSGFDEHSVVDPGSVPGASWIFRLDRIRDTGAFLATEMDGRPLTPDHGFPVRLVVPGWYGCTAIKWVNEIALLDDAAPATDQMHEYAGRTLQDPVGPRDPTLIRAGRRPEGPPLAKDFQPATVDPVALPIRVERLAAGDGSASYRVVGLLWGGLALPRGLRIRFNADMPFAPVEEITPADARTWTLWSHRFASPKPGRYRIEVAVADPGVRTRRLDSGYYTREIEIAL
jgi:DMSO/TMAO reductase YedYZ molybdopterin-dependent catalytic subunit